MINLLPPEGHRAVKQEYFFRVGASLLFLFSFVAIFITIAFIPTYVLVGAQIKSFEANNVQESNTEGTNKTTEAEVREIENILGQLNTTPMSDSPSEIIEEIQKNASPAISFKTFRVGVISAGTTTIQVQGLAETRESLARFKNALEASSLFQKAEVPISDLARETELPFMISITPKKK